MPLMSPVTSIANEKSFQFCIPKIILPLMLSSSCSSWRPLMSSNNGIDCTEYMKVFILFQQTLC